MKNAKTMSAPDRLHELNDAALWPLIDAPDEITREAEIEDLLTRTVRPLIASIVRRFRRVEANLHSDEVEEISSLILLRFIRKVRATMLYEEHAIQALASYISKLAYNALHDFRRRRYPERHRLKRNLRYIMTRHPDFAVWQTEDDPVAGLSEWKGELPGSVLTPLTRSSATSVMCDKERPVEALRAIVARIGHPVVFEALVDVVADLWKVHDLVPESGDFPPDERGDQHRAFENREYLEALWLEIRQLPANQRTALLLNLRDSSGGNALTLFILLNVAGAGEIAEAVGVTLEKLDEMWGQLPIDDLTIAARLGLTRQQVIHLRKAARLRLARRMARWK